MESTLHRQLKVHFSASPLEVAVAGFRADGIDRRGRLIEIQAGPLGALRPKLTVLLPEHPIRVIKPIISVRRLVHRARLDGPDLAARRSPRKGQPLDLFDELVGLARLFPHPNLAIEIVTVEIDEIRLPSRRWRGYRVADRSLTAITGSIALRRAADLWRLIDPPPPDPFTTRELATSLNRPMSFAQRVAYCLRHSGAVQAVGKQGNRIVYARRRKAAIRVGG